MCIACFHYHLKDGLKVSIKQQSMRGAFFLNFCFITQPVAEGKVTECIENIYIKSLGTNSDDV